MYVGLRFVVIVTDIFWKFPYIQKQMEYYNKFHRPIIYFQQLSFFIYLYPALPTGLFKNKSQACIIISINIHSVSKRLELFCLLEVHLNNSIRY